MLANAIREQKKDAKQVSAKPPIQEVLTSSPSTLRNKNSGASSQSTIGRGGEVLQPSSSMLNRAGGALGNSFKNPLKRSSSGISGSSGEGDSNKLRKLSSLSRQQSFSTSAGMKRQDSGLLNKLHSDFGFDENDFDEDLLMLASDPATNPKVEQQAPVVKYPDLKRPEPYYPKLPVKPESFTSPPAKSTVLKSFANSSAPLPWSSSPETYKTSFHHVALDAQQASASKPSATGAKKSLFGRQLQSTTSGGSARAQTLDPKLETASTGTKLSEVSLRAQNLQRQGYQDIPISLDSSPELPREKRRILPWKNIKEEDETDLAPGESKRLKRVKKERLSPIPPPTGAPDVKKSDVYFWEDVTPSAIKAEQKKFRQQRDAEVDVKTGVPSAADDQDHKKPGRITTAVKNVSPVFLSDEQTRVLNLVVERKKSVFFTGSAGTGKSVLMREIISTLRKKYDKSFDAVAVTASTGLAACNIGGNTLHSFAGIGLGSEPADQLIKKIKKNQKALQRWQRTRVLVIDEISMIDGVLFDKLEQIARVIRKKPMAFGGIQLVITGDFFQLPPVAKGGESSFTFDAVTWKTAIDHTIGLTHVFRQKDPIFAGMLNEMRVGKLSPASVKAFHALNRPLTETRGQEATELFPTRQEVENANTNRMRRLGGTSIEFLAIDGGSIKDINQRSKLLSNCMAPPNLTLKKGAQVMLIKNIDETLVNGSVGHVMAFMTEQEFDFYDNNEHLFINGFPDFECYQAPTANNSTTQPNVPVPVGHDSNMPKELRDFLARYQHPGAANTAPRFPVVRFRSADGGARDLLCQRETWKMEQPNGEVLASRAQIPLILAWALSIHKAQGQTLEMVKVDLGRIFEKGQAYVALSRATTQEGLQVARFDPRKVMAHEKVRSFYDTLYGVETIGGMPRTSVPIKQTPALGSMDSGITAEDEEALLAMGF